MYVRNLQQEKGIGKIFAAVWTELHRKGLEGGTAIPCPEEETGLPTTLLRVFLTHPDCWSAIPVRTQRVIRLLTGTWQSHVSL